jgi:hypothetical protein
MHTASTTCLPLRPVLCAAAGCGAIAQARTSVPTISNRNGVLDNEERPATDVRSFAFIGCPFCRIHTRKSKFGSPGGDRSGY